MKRSMLMASCLVTLLLSTSVQAAERDHGVRLLELTRLIDQLPNSDQLRAAGAGESGEALAAIAMDSSLDRYTRVRAMGFVGLFPSVGAERALARVADDARFDDLEVRIAAISSLAHLEKQRGLSRLARLIAEDEVQIRAAATRAVARIPGPAATRLLSTRAEAESVTWVRELTARKLSARRSS